MTVEKLITRLLGKKGKAAMVAAAKGLSAEQRPVQGQQSRKAFERDLERHINALGLHIAEDRRREAMATGLAIAIADAELAIAKIRGIGLFRSSRYAFQGSLIADIAEAMLQIRPMLNLHPDRIVYLESVLALTRLAPNVGEYHDGIAQFLRDRQDVALKTILVLTNSIFYFGWPFDPDQDSMEAIHYSAEELCEAASLLLSMYRERFKITSEVCDFADEKTVKKSEEPYIHLLVAAAKINKFREAETTIDGRPYQAVLNGTSVTVSSIDPGIEKSVRLGYIQSEFQVIKRLQTLKKYHTSPSMRDFVAGASSDGALQQIVRLVDEPIKRLTLRLPTAQEIFGLFSSDHRFRDEIESLLYLNVNSFDDGTAPIVYRVSDRITSDDIFKLQRYFRFLSCMYQKRLEDFSEAERRLLTFRSTVFVMPREEIINQLNLIFLDIEKTRELVTYLTLDEDRPFVDLQYTPFIVFGDFVVIAPQIVATSNLVRNIVTANKLPRLDETTGDPMQNAVVAALKGAGFKVEPEAMIRVNKKEVEIDIVAWRDDTLFLFECKNAYLPCSAHEIRNSFEHIDHAGHQLTLREETFRNPANQKAIYKKLEWDVRPTTAIHTGILIANRVFHTAKMSGHPVRHAHEFMNVVLRGFVASGEKRFTFWQEPAFQTSDLVAYLRGEVLIEDLLSSLDETTIPYQFGPRSLEFVTYRMFTEVLDAKIRASLRPVEGARQ